MLIKDYIGSECLTRLRSQAEENSKQHRAELASKILNDFQVRSIISLINNPEIIDLYVRSCIPEDLNYFKHYADNPLYILLHDAVHVFVHMAALNLLQESQEFRNLMVFSFGGRDCLLIPLCFLSQLTSAGEDFVEIFWREVADIDDVIDVQSIDQFKTGISSYRREMKDLILDWFTFLAHAEDSTEQVSVTAMNFYEWRKEVKRNPHTSIDQSVGLHVLQRMGCSSNYEFDNFLKEIYESIYNEVIRILSRISNNSTDTVFEQYEQLVAAEKDYWK